MRRGRKPQPTRLLRLHGAYRQDRHGDRLEPLAPGPLLDPPSYLSEAQAARFREIIETAPQNLLRRWDAPTLAGFVISESVVIEANKARAEGQLLDRTERGALTVAALLKVQRSYLPLMKQFGELLGFSPVSRSTLKIADSADREDEDPREWARWEWIKIAAQRHPEGSPEKEAQRQRLDYLHSIMYPRPARSRRKKGEAELAEAEPTTAQPS
jgi:phage terminase small subunit